MLIKFYYGGSSSLFYENGLPTYWRTTRVWCFRKTRTCIHTPGYPPMIPTDLSHSSLLSAMDGAKLVYFDGRLHETAAIVAEEVFSSHLSLQAFWAHKNIPVSNTFKMEMNCMLLGFPVQANRGGIPILIDAERKREGLDNLLSFASYVVCSTKFPQASYPLYKLHLSSLWAARICLLNELDCH